MTKNEAKIKIRKLIEKYENLTPQEKQINEEDTKAKFIRPLFEILGWDFENDVSFEHAISKDRADYAFKINNTIKFFVEAKRINADLEDTKFAKQAIEYAWLKSVDWAILTDFEGLKVFYPSSNPLPYPALTFKYNDYYDHFDELWLISKESFTNNELNKYAERHGHKPSTTKIGKQLSLDLITWRKELTEQFRLGNDNKIPEEILDEGVQKILDRLIFIRTCEDRGLENESKLLSLYHIWEKNGRKPRNFLQSLAEVFEEYKQNYNSGLFEYHPCIEWDAYTDAFDKIINGLYQSSAGQKYDFSAINADVLGSVYEQYLGHLLQKSKDGDEDKKKRKSQGIYYTPTFIVDYIVQNTLGEVLKEKSKEEIKNLKILDPACGSGSFLIKAFDYLSNYYENKKQSKFDKSTKLGQLEQIFNNKKVDELSTPRKIDILRNNIYGVDLDQQAVEIAQLNLLLKALDQKQPLPHLGNIKCGNSLIDDPKIVGIRAFNWNDEFPEVMKDDGFDIIIGNPPYVFTRDVEFQASFKKYVRENYFKNLESISSSHAKQSGKVNLYALFLIKAIQLLKDGGRFGFIIPNNILRATTYDIVRRFILDNCKIIKIVDLGSGIFEGVTASTIIIVLQKERDKNKRDKNKTIINFGINNLSNKKEIEQKEFLENTSYAFNITLNTEGRDFSKKISDNTISLGEITSIYCGIATGANKKAMVANYRKNEHYKPMLEGKDIKQFYPIFANRYILYDKKLLHRPREEHIFLNPEKIVTQRIGGGNRVLVASYDNQQFYTFNSTNNILLKNKNYSLKYIVAILNSSLMNWYYVNKFTNKSMLTVNISKTYLDQLPIKQISKLQQQPIIDLTNEMLKLNKKLQTNEQGTNRWNQLKSEIYRTDQSIDQKVYELYGLNKKEIEIIEKG